MPDHFHVLITPAPDVSLEKAMQFIKEASPSASRASWTCGCAASTRVRSRAKRSS
jgi:REP element-mobilizing transposase RayT